MQTRLAARGSTRKPVYLLITFLMVLAAYTKGNMILWQDHLDHIDSWQPFADSMDLSAIRSRRGHAMRMHFTLDPQQDYAVAGRAVEQALPKAFAVHFFVRAQAPRAHFEIKLFEANGNVYWYRREDLKIPGQWKRIRIPSTDFEYAWGPHPDAPLQQLQRIEFSVTRTGDGTGYIDIDELRFIEEQAPETIHLAASASSQSKAYPAAHAVDGKDSTRWAGAPRDPQWIAIDLGTVVSLTGLLIHWETAYASAYDIDVSLDGSSWQNVFHTDTGDGGSDTVRFPVTPARHLRLTARRRGTPFGYSIFELIPCTTDAPWGLGQPGHFFLFEHPAGDRKTRHRFFVPSSWQHASPFLQLTDPHGPLTVYLNGKKLGQCPAARKQYRLSLTGHLKCSAYNQLAFSSRHPEPGAACRSALVTAGTTALQKGLSALRHKDPLAYFKMRAMIAPAGCYPHWLSGQQGFWTVTGIDGGERESLLCEDGTLEPYKSFSLSPFVRLNQALLTRTDVRLEQSLQDDRWPIPSVTWHHERFAMQCTATAFGSPAQAVTLLRYTVSNRTAETLSGSFYLALRPFEVNPPWQWGGLSRLDNIRLHKGYIQANEYRVIPLTDGYTFGATAPWAGNITSLLLKNTMPERTAIHDPDGLASAALAYPFTLAVHSQTCFHVLVPLVPPIPPASNTPAAITRPAAKQILRRQHQYWQQRLQIPFYVPVTQIMNSVYANLGYILINRDGPSLQPGSRAYEAAWMRDGVLMAVTLLRLGYPREAMDFIAWYEGFIGNDGRIPAIVIPARNEINPVHEYDSQGEFVYGVRQCYAYTHNSQWLAERWPAVKQALEYLELLRNREVTDFLENTPGQERYYGILPKCVSHEGYYPEPGNHSYWDDFWGLRGWKDGRFMADALGHTQAVAWMQQEEQELREALLNSIAHTRRHYNIPYLPGCAELGDFDPSSSAVAVTACDEASYLPEGLMQQTMDRYRHAFRDRLQPGWQGSFSPYEFRIAKALLLMGRRQQARILFDYLMTVQRPPGWHQWPEAVYEPPDTPGYIGDMPHTWISAAFIDLVRTMLLYERESDQSLVLGAGIPWKWYACPQPVKIIQAPTWWGPVSMHVAHRAGETIIRFSGTADPPGGFEWVPPEQAGLEMHSPQPSVRGTGHRMQFDRLPVEIHARSVDSDGAAAMP